jgi:hypothetical protein
VVYQFTMYKMRGWASRPDHRNIVCMLSGLCGGYGRSVWTECSSRSLHCGGRGSCDDFNQERNHRGLANQRIRSEVTAFPVA